LPEGRACALKKWGHDLPRGPPLYIYTLCPRQLLLITVSRKSEQTCNRSVKTCCQQADIWMRSLALYLSVDVLTGPQRPVNRSVTSCCDRAAAMLFSTGLLQAVATELQQCCFQLVCRKLLTQSCSNAVFNNLWQT
jgi:hypothetical protein